jgi:hypothetical protein
MNKVNRNLLRVAEASVLVLPKHGLLLKRGGQILCANKGQLLIGKE